MTGRKDRPGGLSHLPRDKDELVDGDARALMLDELEAVVDYVELIEARHVGRNGELKRFRNRHNRVA